MKILIGGDLVPTKSNISFFENGDRVELIGDKLCELIDYSDFCIFNLEVPITDTWSPIKKSGPNLICPLKTINGIKSINRHFFTLANNHIMDQGEQGLRSTIEILTSNYICFAGAGFNLTEAQKPFIITIERKSLGIYCCAEHEFSIARDDKAGANPFDLLESVDHIKFLSDSCDYVIVLYHGGKEKYRYPSPYLQKICHKMIEKGADLVVCQHSHCIGCEERYKDGVILYGQGNFIFDYLDSDYWKTSLLVVLNIIDNKFHVEYLPIVKKNQTVRLAEEDAGKILDEFYQRGDKIKQAGFIEDEYRNYAMKSIIEYERVCMGKRGTTFLVRFLDKMLNYKITKGYYKKTDLIKIKNYIECEAHRELFIEGIESICRLDKN